MHPSKSVIFLTTTTGAGYGLLFLTIVLEMTGQSPGDRAPLLVSYGAAYLLVTAGLLASTFHLGHPERAWRALSQWRSSWLSREGVAAVFTYLPTMLFVAISSFVSPTNPAALAVGVVGLVGCAATVWCTAMIYASLKPVHAWHNGYVLAAYLWLALMTGGLILEFVLLCFSVRVPVLEIALPVTLLVGVALKWAYWRRIDAQPSASTPETATGLGRFGKVHLLEAPHSQANYLMQEMVFQIARSHATALRRAVYALLFAVPAALGIAVGLLPASAAAVASGLAVLSAAIGVAVERWLFFAEARHTVGLYYGQSAA